MCAPWLPQFCLDCPSQGVSQQEIPGYPSSSAQVVTTDGEPGAPLPCRMDVQDTQESAEAGDPFPPLLPHLATQGRAFVQLLCSQDVPMDHVLHVGEVHQVLPVPAHRKGSSAPRQAGLKICSWQKGGLSPGVNLSQVSLSFSRSLVLPFQAIPWRRVGLPSVISEKEGLPASQLPAKLTFLQQHHFQTSRVAKCLGAADPAGLGSAAIRGSRTNRGRGVTSTQSVTQGQASSQELLGSRNSDSPNKPPSAPAG